MGFEQKLNQQLNKHPNVKKRIKRIYQHAMYAVSSKIESEGDIVRISPDDTEHEYFFGYYGICPEDVSGRYVLCLKANDTCRSVAPSDPAEILLIDTGKAENDPTRIKNIAVTHTWNVQQGCMMQWLGPGFDKEIIYNDFRYGKYCSVVLDVFSGQERVLSMPVYCVSADGSFALTLDFSRLHRMRPGYGYSNLPDKTDGHNIPEGPCIWKLDIITNTVTPVLNYSDFSNFEPRFEMKGAEHKVNHIMLSPNGKRFMILHRWFQGERKYSRLITVNIDGSEMYNLSDDDMVSHCYWKNNEEIIAFENKKKTGAGYYLMKDKTHEYKRLWPHIVSDGHPSYSRDGRLVVSDTYPNRNRIANIKILNDDMNIVVARVFAPFKYDNDTRCDLHPRWSRDEKRIWFDSVYEGHRGLYYVDLSGIKIAYSDRIGEALPNAEGKRKKIVYLMTSCKKLGPTQQTLNIIKNLEQDKFEPILITIYDEDKDSRMAEFLPYVYAHYHIKTGKKSIILGTDSALCKKLEELNPDLIHTVGVFPDYAVSKIGNYQQILTLRNYVYDDYPAKFGIVKGTVLAQMQIYAMKHAAKTITCSQSLSKIYKEKLGLDFSFIRNGVDIDQYITPNKGEKEAIRKALCLPQDKFIFVYTGQFIERKNIPFLLEAYTEQFGYDHYLLLLGGGPELKPLREKYIEYENIDFRGNVSNVNYYLKACDCYISTSKSEGLPNGVLEAMATGVPVVLSDIMQHVEIFEADQRIGYLYEKGNKEDLKIQLKKMLSGDNEAMKRAAYESAHVNFSAQEMSRQYQKEYLRIGR